MNEIRRTIDLAIRVVWSTPSVASMADSLEFAEGDDDVATIVGMTAPLKAAVMLLVLLPRMGVVITLLWMGSRWLLSTFSFEGFLLSVVGLEFIVHLKALLYETLAPRRNKHETENTLLLPLRKREGPSVAAYLGAFLWGIGAIGWALAYMYVFQNVLPDYKWDIQTVCVDYLIEQSKVRTEAAIRHSIGDQTGTTDSF